LAKQTNFLSEVRGGKVESQYSVGALSPSGRSISNHSSALGELRR
jgi:hypothetical protein